jgi:hypothetical protein
MAESIMDHLRENAINGGDCVEEEKLIKGVHRSCYGGCGDSEDGSEGDEYF